MCCKSGIRTSKEQPFPVVIGIGDPAYSTFLSFLFAFLLFVAQLHQAFVYFNLWREGGFSATAKNVE